MKVETLQEKLSELSIQWYVHMLHMDNTNISLRTSQTKVE